MGSMSFLLPNPLPPGADEAVRRACFAGGYDQTPVPTRVEFRGNRLVVSRTLSESGYLLVPWPVEPFGSFVTTTATLRERACRRPTARALARPDCGLTSALAVYGKIGSGSPCRSRSLALAVQ